MAINYTSKRSHQPKNVRVRTTVPIGRDCHLTQSNLTRPTQLYNNANLTALKLVENLAYY